MCVPWLFLDAVLFQRQKGFISSFTKTNIIFPFGKLEKYSTIKCWLFFPSIRPWDPGMMTQDGQDSLAVIKPSYQPSTSGILAEATSIQRGVDSLPKHWLWSGDLVQWFSAMFHEDLGCHEGVSGIPQAFILFPFHSGKKNKLFWKL